MDDGNRAYFQGHFAAAAAAYADVVQTDPKNGLAWYRLGVSYMQIGKLSEAAQPLNQALALGFRPAYTLYSLAELQAQLGNRAAALDYLKRSFAISPTPPSIVQNDDALKSLHGTAEYNTLVAQSKQTFEPCTLDRRYRALDFWVGNWTVTNPQQAKAGTSRVERILNDCVIFENWTSASGYGGKSFSFFDPVKGVWIQHWVDGQTGFRDWAGSVKGDSLVFTSEGTDSAGKPQHMRMTYTPLSGGRVRQLIETSYDGTTWTAAFDGIYTPSP